MRPLAIFGAGAFGHELVDYCADLGWPVAGLVDDRPESELPGLPVPFLGGLDDLDVSGYDWLVGVGQAVQRRRVHRRLAGRGARFATLIHPRAYVAPTATVAAGSVICPFGLVAAHAAVGGNVVVNTHASVGHHGVIADHAVFCPYATTNGHVRLGEAVFLGTAAVVTPGLTVGRDSRFAAGATAVTDIPPGSLVIGNPAVATPRYDLDG